jgi:hypothetical protein
VWQRPKADQAAMVLHQLGGDQAKPRRFPYPIAMPASQSVHFGHHFVPTYKNPSNFGCFIRAKMRNINLA